MADREGPGMKDKLGLKALAWLDERLRFRDYADAVQSFNMGMQRQMPRSHTQNYKLRSIWYWYPLYCLGGIAFVAFLITLVTGIVLAFHYVPSGEIIDEATQMTVAYQSINTIETEVFFGFMLRSLHRWAAQIMVASVLLHMVRVYFTGAYKKPRELNWLLGVGLLFITIMFGYSGYLLPWDDLAGWAANIGFRITAQSPLIGSTLASIAFGNFPEDTVSRMYLWHVVVLPLVGLGAMIAHMVIVWIQGMAEPH